MLALFTKPYSSLPPLTVSNSITHPQLILSIAKTNPFLAPTHPTSRTVVYSMMVRRKVTTTDRDTATLYWPTCTTKYFHHPRPTPHFIVPDMPLLA
jgi:hypothetical protein